ncbi:FAD-dependent oxidoreductase [Lacrimispora sp. BS-2]|uniref:FAD-dependent oxidoreductase n=1 Tax=Lacrimispora sp. BS-2 TaxID=3151850 RepID=A0AAU7PSJ0_9FIRM
MGGPQDLESEIEGRKQAHAIVVFMRKYIPGFENAVIVTTGPHIGIRESRKINGAYRLTASNLLQNKMFEDAIARIQICAAIRVTPILMAISEGAGAAAAIAAKQGIGIAAIGAAQLQNFFKGSWRFS